MAVNDLMQIYLFGGVGTGKKTLKNTLNRQKEERNEGQWSAIDIPGTLATIL